MDHICAGAPHVPSARSLLAQGPALRCDPGPPTVRQRSEPTRRTRPGLTCAHNIDHYFYLLLLHRNAPQLKRVALWAGGSVQARVNCRGPGRQTPPCPSLSEPDEAPRVGVPAVHLLIHHVAVRVSHACRLEGVGLHTREVEAGSIPGNINSPAVIKRLPVIVLSKDLKILPENKRFWICIWIVHL